MLPHLDCENINVLLSDPLYWIELVLDMLKGLRGNAKLFLSWMQLQNRHLLMTCYQKVGRSSQVLLVDAGFSLEAGNWRTPAATFDISAAYFC